ncbi:MAG: hypothetical protein U0787_24230 [Polyangia bacterium]
MSRRQNDLAGTASANRARPADPLAARMSGATLIAVLLHAGLAVYAYHHPMPLGPRKTGPITVDVVVRRPPPPPVPEKPPEPLPVPTVVPQPVAMQPQRATPLPKELQPVQRPENSAPGSSAISVPVQPPLPPGETGPTGMPKGPLVLFPKSLGGVVGGPIAGAPIPKGPDRLFKDERLEEKKEPDFVLVPDKDGGYKSETRNFVARIKSDGSIDFENRFPIGFQKGGTFTFDVTELAMRGAKQDPYAAEKRKFLEFSDKLRTDLRKRSIQERRESALASFSRELHAIWNSGRSAAARRRELYEKWADCSDSKEDVLGKRGRDAVEDFVRTYLPSGSSDAFTSDELSDFRRERGQETAFDPYRNSK